jgi:hypothetical protein
VARRHLQSTSGFDPSFRRAEDIELAYRLGELGLEFVFQPTAAVMHAPGRSLAAWRAMATLYGRADVRIWRDKGQRYLLKTIAREFRRRHWTVRQAVRLLASGGLRTGAAASAAIGLAAVAGRLGAPGPSLHCYSLAYNLLYYRGLFVELNSPAQFKSVLMDPAEVPTVGAAPAGST